MSRAIAWILTSALFLALVSACSGPESDSAPAQSDADSEASDASAHASGASGTSDGAASGADSGAWFEDATESWGVDFTHDSGASGDLLFPEMMGGGIAIFDADGDDDLDLYFVNGAALGDGTGGSAGGSSGGPVNRLWIQQDGRFVDATEGSGLDDGGYGTGVAVGDFDNDGRQDVYVANIGQDRLFHGNGDGTFTDVTKSAGIDVGAWSTSAAFCDVDRDGWLDLYVVRYVVWDRGIECTDKAGRNEYCGPDSFPDETDVLLENNGDGTFRDISKSSGISEFTGAGLGVVCEDFDDDGWTDIYVANDGDPNLLWMNQHTGSNGRVTFVDDALIMGTSVNAQGLSEAGMGVVAADFDNDTDFDLFVTHLRDETNTFYRNLGQGIGFADESTQVGLATGSTPYTGFGTAPFDADLDGDLDLVIANGRVTRGDPLTQAIGPPWNAYAEPNLVYANDSGAGFRLVTGGIEDHVHVSRALATGDLDGDGDLDVVLGNVQGPVRIYRNLARERAADGAPHWLLVDTVDPRLGANGRRALGARVTVTAAGTSQVRTIQSAMSYLSSSDPRAHFGLGDAAKTDSITVRWPDGLEETFPGADADQVVVLRRGEGSK